MRILCDENIRRSIIGLLQQEGHDVERVQDVLELGFEDPEILAYCRSSERALLTNDDDFIEFDEHPGVLFLDQQTTPPREAAVAIQRIEQYTGRDDRENVVYHVPDGWI